MKEVYNSLYSSAFEFQKQQEEHKQTHGTVDQKIQGKVNMILDFIDHNKIVLGIREPLTRMKLARDVTCAATPKVIEEEDLELMEKLQVPPSKASVKKANSLATKVQKVL